MDGVEYFVGQLLCLVDLRNVRENQKYDNGLYAVVHSAESPIQSTDNIEHIIEWFNLPKRRNNGGRIFHLLDVETISQAAMVIPDIGGSERKIGLVHPQQKWSNIFQNM